ncbi:MAG: Hsp20/alpha crystallin family protein [SAR324 cluster bacterium]|nr:Hsp20/alpha crystallin family protein [SAR324 cluster bacterium]
MSIENKELNKTEQNVTKKESGEEKTVAGRFYSPPTDIVETDKSLIVNMDMPGVLKENLAIRLENQVLEVEGHIDFSPYQGLNPIYTEYNVGHYTRKFTVSSSIDTDKIEASLNDGVLTLTLPKAEKAQPRQIQIS